MKRREKRMRGCPRRAQPEQAMICWNVLRCLSPPKAPHLDECRDKVMGKADRDNRERGGRQLDNRQTDREIDRDTQTDRHTDRHRQTGRQKER
jgi:hypothetical protein